MPIQQDSSHPTGVSGPPGKSVAVARDRKAEAALEMRHQHYSWAEIASVLGYPTPRHALIAVEKALQKGLKVDESKEFMRSLAGSKLEELIYSVWAKATNPDHPEHLTAVTKARELIADHAKMYGYIAPTEVNIYNPLESEIEQLVGKMLNQGAPEIAGGDIFEMEQNEEGIFETLPSVDDF